jgi:hypothetical protein
MSTMENGIGVQGVEKSVSAVYCVRMGMFVNTHQMGFIQVELEKNFRLCAAIAVIPA